MANLKKVGSVIPVALLVVALLLGCGARGVAGPSDGAVTQSKPAPAAAGADPQLNQRYVDPDLDVEQWIGRFEVESREVFAARDEVLAAVGVKSGDRIADVGAGTGLYTRIFSKAVGETGWVYAVDISPRFIEHINQSADRDGLRNVTSVLSRVDSVMLPPESVDRAFICDTYHHFETPAQTLASVHRALRPGGELVVIDFIRAEGVSREFIMGHVRAGKDVFRAEIESFGFELIGDVSIKGFEENYFLKFRKR